MRVLFATPVPPLVTKPRPHHFIRGLAERGHEIHLITMVPSPSAAAALEGESGWREIADVCSSIDVIHMTRLKSFAQCLLALPTATPLRVAYCKSGELDRRARELIRRHRIDILHVDRERLAPVLESIPVPKVLDPTDCITRFLAEVVRFGRLHERLISACELVKMRGFERTMHRNYAACLLAGQEDEFALLELGSTGAFEVLPNGVDESLLECVRKEVDGSLLFVGNMSYAPNVDAAMWFTNEILPLIKANRPNVRLNIVGSAPNRLIRRLGRRPGVVVTGAVPSIAPFLSSAMVFVAPMRIGGGFPNKVAEALGAGVPSVATHEGHAGIPHAVPGIHLLEANDAHSFARQTLNLLEDQALRKRIGDSGREFIATHFRWSAAVVRLEELYRSTLKLASADGGRS
jgi:glycosyltransferase involved in cell wall biosynthesis